MVLVVPHSVTVYDLYWSVDSTGDRQRLDTRVFGVATGLGQMGRGTPEYGEWRGGQGRAKLFTTLLINARRNTPKVPAIKPNKVPNLVFCGEII